jgi:hypothetical protein
MEAIGSYGVGRMSQEELDRLERHALPGAGNGPCGGVVVGCGALYWC